MAVAVRQALRSHFDLVRIPNVVTAVADIVAGFLYVGGQRDEWSALLLLIGASACLYGGGAALNDVCDVVRDRRERPERPIPSGRLSRRSAGAVAVALLGLGLALSIAVSGRSGAVAGLLILNIVLYDVLLKETWLAPPLMGLCRALNLTLAMSLAGDIAPSIVVVPVLALWVYTTSLTLFARSETSVTSRLPLIAGAIGIGAGVAGLASLAWVLPNVYLSFLIPVSVLAVALVYRGGSVARTATTGSVQRCVKTFVLSLILFDACLVWAACGVGVALAVVTLMIPALALQRWFRVA